MAIHGNIEVALKNIQSQLIMNYRLKAASQEAAFLFQLFKNRQIPDFLTGPSPDPNGTFAGR